ncbi:MAG TPA: TonB-dependent receptor [Bacteroidia bacterium]|nr:TonB-dependent receptor [Bacteroidia bacterium]HRS58762.1 TonB-dependent receptor [Bacteroidia bacterium]HRU67904.1 TonB-dependent receptor [Bacteroidia bacterium]
MNSGGKINLLMAFCLILLPFIGFTQSKYSISGYVKDASSGEGLLGASIYVVEIEKGTITNHYGFYSLQLPAGKYHLKISYVGYEAKEMTISLSKNIQQNIELQPTVLVASEVEIKAERKNENVTSGDVGKIDLKPEVIKELPAILGEVDILKTIQLLPGVMSAGEGNVGFYVRGGGADQNLVLLDEAPVFNTGHLFGFFSVFNADAVNSLSLYKGGMPAEFGGRLSSVLDVTMKEGNNRSYHASGGIGLISSRLMVEGPIVKDKSSFLFAGRRTYADFLIQPFIKNTNFSGNGYYFYDFNAKVNYLFSQKDRLFLSAYLGDDVFTFHSPDNDFKVSIPWGNYTTTLRWNHLFSDKLFMNASFIYNDYNFRLDVDNDNFKVNFFSGIKDINVKTDFGYYPGLLHKINFGTEYVYHTFIPSTARASTADGLNINTDDLKRKYAHETAVYLSDDYDLNDWLKITSGLRFSTFTIVPPYSVLLKNDEGVIYDTQHFRAGDGNKTYSGLEPRINIRIMLSQKASVKLSANYNKQYIHLVSNSTSTLPTDVWVPSSKMVKPQSGYQFSAGYFRNFLDNSFETSVEVYYKKMFNQIEFRDGYIEELGRELEWDFVFGEGKSYGLELFINKKYGDFTGWIGYTLSKTTRHFEDLVTKDFPAKFDRTHDLSVVLLYQLNDRISFGATFIYGTGVATTLPMRRYIIENTLVNEYMPRNSYRIEPYHRLDISATIKSKKERKIDSEWVFSIYNVYNHKNVYFLYIDTEGDPLKGTLDIQAKKVSLFPIIPSVTWNFKF